MPMLWDERSINIPLALTDLARRATVLRPCVVKNWEVLARNLLQTGEVKEAIAVLVEAVSKFPTEPRLHVMLADAYYGARRFDDAHDVLNRLSSDRESTIFRLELLMKMRVSKDLARTATDTLAL